MVSRSFPSPKPSRAQRPHRFSRCAVISLLCRAVSSFSCLAQDCLHTTPPTLFFYMFCQRHSSSPTPDQHARHGRDRHRYGDHGGDRIDHHDGRAVDHRRDDNHDAGAAASDASLLLSPLPLPLSSSSPSSSLTLASGTCPAAPASLLVPCGAHRAAMRLGPAVDPARCDFLGGFVF